MTKLKKYLNNLLPSFLLKKLKNTFFKSFMGVMGLKIVSSGLGFVLNVLLARLLGVKGLGVYNYTLAWHQLLIIPALLGLDNLLVREVAIYKAQSSWGLLRGILRWSNQIVLVSSFAIASIAIAIVWNLDIKDQPQMFLAFVIAMLLLPLTALRNVRLSTMRGLNQVFMGLMPEMLIVPLVVMVLTGCLYLFVDQQLTAAWVLGTRLIATIITFAIGIHLLQKALPEPVKHTAYEYRTKTWSTKLLPFMLLGGMYVITSRSDMLMIGAIKGTEAAGLYGPIVQGVQLLAFVLTAINSVLGPSIASLYTEKKLGKIQQVVTKSSRMMLLISLPIAAFLLFGGNWYLSLFGSEFVRARSALTILCLGQLFSIAAGSVGTILNMTGNEKYNLKGSVVNVLLNIILNWLWIPNWGINGAAAATAVSTVIVNTLQVIWVRNKIGINSTVLGRF